MKYLLILIAFTANGCMGQYPLQKAYQKKDTAKVFYGIAGIQKEPFDSAKYYFHKFLFFQNKMDKATGRAFVRFEDSCMKYYKLLYKK